jgi:hypothetical protein
MTLGDGDVTLVCRYGTFHIVDLKLRIASLMLRITDNELL